jgi:hypothetical protein
VISGRSLPLHVQKAVWGRALIYQVLDVHQVEVAEAGYEVLWAGMRERVRADTEQEVELPSAGSLISYLTGLSRRIREGMSFPSLDAEKACTPLLDDIDRVLAVAGQAQEDLLFAAFGDALQAAANLYGRHGMEVPSDLLKRTTVTFEHQRGEVRTILPIQLQAVTTLTDLPDGPAANVNVLVSPKGLDELTVFSLPYVLLHECICHVLQGPWQTGRIQGDPSDRFAEGWMDVAAYLAHETMQRPWRAKVPGPDLLTAPRPASQSDAAWMVHKARHKAQKEDRAWSARAMGTDAARGMQELLGKLPESRHDATAAFLRLSLRLNASSLTNQERALFVTKAYQALQNRTEYTLTPLLRCYLGTNDLQGLVHGIISLFV